jgi:N-acetyl-beta-hexosaminidase
MPSTNPTREQFRAIGDLPGEGPVLMINLMRFRAEAAYAQSDPEFGEAPISGEEAYRRYAEDRGAGIEARRVAGLGGPAYADRDRT